MNSPHPGFAIGGLAERSQRSGNSASPLLQRFDRTAANTMACEAILESVQKKEWDDRKERGESVARIAKRSIASAQWQIADGFVTWSSVCFDRAHFRSGSVLLQATKVRNSIMTSLS